MFLSLMAGSDDPEAIAALLANPASFGLKMLLYMLISIPFMMAIWFAPALIAINDVPVIEAMKLSFKGCLKNMVPF